MRNYVIINGVNSNTIQGLAINLLPPITKPMMRTQIEEIDGRDGDIITELGYSAYDKEMEIGLWGTYDINQVISFFNGEGTITFSNESDKQYYFKIINQIDYEKLAKFKVATVTFHCQPFKYPTTETQIVTNGSTVNEEGTSILISNSNEGSPIESVLKGDTQQNGTPTPSAPIPVETVTGGQVVTVCGKNLLRYDLAYLKSKNTTGTWNNNVYTSNGLTITINDDLSIKINGTSTAQETFFINQEKMYLPTGTYYLSGSINGSNTTYDIRTYNYNSGGISSQCFTGAKETAFVNNNQNFNVSIVVRNGQTLNNVLFYPMLSTTNDTTYEPYIGNNYEINLGKNLFNKNGSIISGGRLDNVGAIYNQTGYYTSEFIRVSPSTIYSKNSPTQDAYHRVCFYTSTDVSGFISNTTTNTFTTPSTAQYLRFCGLETEIDTAQLEKGSSSSYNPYKTPIELCKIGDYQDKIAKSTGKNLFDYQYSNLKNINRCTTSQEANGFKLIATGVSGFGFASLEIDNSLLGKQITISMNSSGKNPSGRLFYHNASGGLTGNVGDFWTTNNAYTTTLPNTLPSNATGIALVLYISQTNNTSGEYAIFTNIQIELGNQASSYEPYGKVWYLNKQINKVVLNGSETYSGGSVATNVYRFFKSIDGIMAYTDSSRYIDRFITDRFKLSTSNEYGASYQYQSNLYFCVSSSEATTYNEFKTWLTTHNTSVYYVLATPTTTEITDTELVSQLNQLANATTISSATNIISSGNLPSILNISTTKIANTTINNIGNIYAKPLLTIYGVGDIGVYLNGTQVLQIALGNSEKITIDVSKMEAYNSDTDVLMNRIVTGDYMNFLIQSGSNTLTFTGIVTKLTMDNYTRWL